MSASAGVAVVVALVAGVAALAGNDAGRPSSLRVTGPGPSTPPVVAVVEPTTSTSTTEPAPTTTTLPPTVSTAPASTVPPPTTTRTTAPTTTVATTTTSTAPAPVACDASEVLVTATPGKASYGPGETVNVTAAAQNRSGHPCYPADPGLQFRDASGKGLGGVALADVFTMGAPGRPPPSWAPDQVLTTSLSWPPLCPGSASGCPPGTYTVVASFGSFRSAPATFNITG